MPRPKPSADSPSRTLTFPAWAEPAAWATTIVGLAVALAIWVPRLAERARSAPLPAPIRVVLADAPAWLPRDERIAIERTVLRSIGSSPFDQDGLREAMDAVRQCGWHAEVRQVHRADVDEVVVEGTWAVPFALVCDAAGEHLVDTHGRLLPRHDPAGQGPKLLRITGVTAARPASFGHAWPGPEVTAALRMASLFVDRPWRGQVATVDLSSWRKDGAIRLATDRGCELVWGRAPGDESPAEVPAMQKLGALQLAFDRSGRIDGGDRTSIDLRGDYTLAR
jgi:hypothetical protein